MPSLVPNLNNVFSIFVGKYIAVANLTNGSVIQLAPETGNKLIDFNTTDTLRIDSIAISSNQVFYITSIVPPGASNMLAIALGACLGVLFAVLLLFAILFIVCLCLRRKKPKDVMEISLLDKDGDINANQFKLNQSLYEIDFSDLSEMKEIGAGGSGTFVFRYSICNCTNL